MSGRPGLKGATLADRQRGLLDVLGRMRDPQERMTWVVERARSGIPFPADWRTSDRLVPGCAARLWLRAEVSEGRGNFACDSDSAILKATAGLVCELHDGLPLAEIRDGNFSVFDDCGLMHLLTENRRRTIRRVREVIHEFAVCDGRMV